MTPVDEYDHWQQYTDPELRARKRAEHRQRMAEKEDAARAEVSRRAANAREDLNLRTRQAQSPTQTVDAGMDPKHREINAGIRGLYLRSKLPPGDPRKNPQYDPEPGEDGEGDGE